MRDENYGVENESRRTQLEVLQTRIGLHGSRMWQLPLTYLGAIVISLNAFNNENLVIPIYIMFFLLALLGFILTFCLHGSEKGYTRTAENMNEIERALGLEEYTRGDSPPRAPYYALMALGIVVNVVAFFYFSFTNNH